MEIKEDLRALAQSIIYAYELRMETVSAFMAAQATRYLKNLRFIRTGRRRMRLSS